MAIPSSVFRVMAEGSDSGGRFLQTFVVFSEARESVRDELCAFAANNDWTIETIDEIEEMEPDDWGGVVPLSGRTYFES